MTDGEECGSRLLRARWPGNKEGGPANDRERVTKAGAAIRR